MIAAEAYPGGHVLSTSCWTTQRIQELRLNILGDILPTELSLIAPRLEILDFDFRHSPSERVFMVNNGDSLPLRTLKLSDCPLPWHSSFNLSGVTTLFLCCVPSPSLLEFLATPSRMQALAVLHLDRTLPGSRGFLSSGAFRVSPKVNLPCLARLVHARLSMVVALLFCVDVTLKTQVRLGVELEANSSVDDYGQLPLPLARRFSPSEDSLSSSPVIRSLALISSFVYERRFTISASEHGDCNPHLSSTHAPRNPQYGRPYERHLSSTHVQTLHVSNPPFSYDFWRKTLGHLDRLQYMKLSEGCMPNLAPLLVPPTDGASRGYTIHEHDPTLGHAFFPALEELELYYITFGSKDDSQMTLL